MKDGCYHQGMKKALSINDNQHHLQLWAGYRPSLDSIIHASTDHRLGQVPGGPEYNVSDHDGLFAWRLNNLARRELLRPYGDQALEVAYETYIFRHTSDSKGAFDFLFEGEPPDTDYRLALHVSPITEPNPDPTERWRKEEYRFCGAFGDGMAYGRRMGMRVANKAIGGRARTRFADQPMGAILNAYGEGTSAVKACMSELIRHPYTWSNGKEYRNSAE